jgi:hypothetical protein
MRRHWSPSSAGMGMCLERAGGPSGGRGADVVTGCDEPQPRGGGAMARVGAVRRGAHQVCWQACRDAGVCWWRAGLAATLSQGCHKSRETRWDTGRHGETISAGRWEGRDNLGHLKTV